ncbi:MAG: hypothetical protein ACRC1K_15615, partial [Planctomycetia bacterium]
MAKRNYTPHQEKIIRRYYENAESLGYQQLQELTTEIYLAEGKKADALWKKVEGALQKLELSPERIAHLM